ncbi:HMG-box domain-containing protein [Aspergillus ibericus CBS 121593]|uniref:HMG box protein n=1 Tax=Aspergillus ibericus CBS 121593 TaxID=1448316 RepID=A0A395GZ62_9EURO|nr:HMG box protein [Aspergillus ibericus CBS 121593]RAL00369.1 HMG box protein [Aspergillus ibericus CBS 121593]
MPLNLARCGGGVLQHLQLSNAFSRPVRQAISQSHVRRMSLATLGRFVTPNVRYAPVSVALSGHLTSGYATAASPKKRTTKKTAPKSIEKAASKTTKKPRAKKVLTEEQKEAKKEAKKASDQKKLVKELKVTALSPPKRVTNYFTLAMLSKYEEIKKEGNLTGKDAFKEAAERAKTISEAERKKFVAAAAANKEAYEESLKEWVKSYTPLEIKQANAARRRLAQIQNKKFFPIHDARLVKRAKIAYLFYAESRHQAGDLKHMPVPERGVQIAEEWRGLTDAEKQKYVRQQEADVERYQREYKEVYGVEAPFVGRNTSK